MLDDIFDSEHDEHGHSTGHAHTIDKHLISDILKECKHDHLNTTMAQRRQRSVSRENSVISYHKLKQHIYKNHPSKKYEKGKENKDRNFSWREDIGILPICKCLNRKQPTRLAQELGIGATLFLMSTRAMTILFAVLSIMNIPLFIFYYSGSRQAEQGFDDIFLKLSLGNAGSSSYTCGEYDF